MIKLANHIMKTYPRPVVALALASVLSACSTLGGAGPSTGAIEDAEGESYVNKSIQVVELDNSVLGQLDEFDARSSFAEVFGDSVPSQTIISAGDVLDIAIWEAPPAVLFGLASSDARLASEPEIAASAEIPQQQVGDDGSVTVPFVGRIAVAGMRPEQVENVIVSRLTGRAHDPQAVVRLVQNKTRAVTVLGEVSSSGRFDLSSRGERLLDAIASAGGTAQPIDQSTVQIARGDRLTMMPLDRVIADPAQNIRLQADDVITVNHQPYSFVALGAVNQNAEVRFEGAGLTLAQALGRVGGLNDRRADVKGVFVFRMEDGEALAPVLTEDAESTREGRVPVVYSLRMTSASSLFAMQDFRMRDGDVLYISTAPGVELERFLTTISSTAFSIVATGNALDSNN